MVANDTLKSLVQMVRKFVGLERTTRYSIRGSYDIHFCREIIANKRRDQLIRYQTLRNDEHAELGSDLAVAKFVLEMRGRVRSGNNRWISEFRKLPQRFDDSFKLTAIEITNSNLLNEGIDNFVGLDHLESLNLSDNYLIDDFACDQLSRQFRNSHTLREVDLSRNSFMTVYGLEILLRIPSLQRINATGTQASKYDDIDLFILAALDECDCRVLVHDDGHQFRCQELKELYQETVPELEASK